MLTDDENIIDIQFAVQYFLKSAADYCSMRASPTTIVAQVAQTAMREVVGHSQMDFALYEGRAQIATETREADAGDSRPLRHRHLCAEGHDAERAAAGTGAGGVRRCGQGEPGSRAPEERRPGLRQRRRAARARHASRLLQEADGYNASVVQRAEGDASRFKQILVEYAKAPAVTRERMYLDMMQSVLGNSSKVLIDQKAGNNLLYLPLDQLLKQSAAGAAVAADAARPARRRRDGGDRRSQPHARALARPRRRGRTMKATTPLLALAGRRRCWCCRSRCTRSTRRQYAIKFQLGEFIDAKTEAGLYLKVPLLQNVKFYDKRHPPLETSDPDRVTTSEKKPLKVDFIAYWRIIDVRKYYQSVHRRRRNGPPPPGADDTRQPGRGDQQAHAARGDIDRARKDHDDDAAKSRRRRQVDRRRGRRRPAASGRAARRSARPGLPADGVGAQTRRQRAALAGRGRIGKNPRRRRPSARGHSRRRIQAGAEDQGRGRREGLRDLRIARTDRIPSSIRSTAASKRTRRRSGARAT